MPDQIIITTLLEDTVSVNDEVTSVIELTSVEDIVTVNEALSEQVVIQEVGAQGVKGDQGDPGIVDMVVGEIPSGTVDGSNATFITAFEFVPESVDVFINGLKQKKVLHFNTSGTQTIIFSESPLPGDQILVNYLK